MIELRKALADLYLAFGDTFHDLAHSCYQKATDMGEYEPSRIGNWYAHPDPSQALQDLDLEGTDKMGVVKEDTDE